MKRQISLPCDCAGSCSVVLVTDWDPVDGDPRDLYIDMYEHVQVAGSLHRRLRIAWNVLRGREPYMQGVSFTDRVKVKRLRDFLTECLDEHDVALRDKHEQGGDDA